MWRVLKRGYEAEPRLLVVAFGLSMLAALPDALLALWLKLLADGLLGSDPRLVAIAAAGLGVSASATWFLRMISDRTSRRFRRSSSGSSKRSQESWRISACSSHVAPFAAA